MLKFIAGAFIGFAMFPMANCRPEKPIGIAHQISRKLDSLPVNFGLIAVAFFGLCGALGGYYLYKNRNFLGAAIVGTGLLIIILGAWFEI